MHTCEVEHVLSNSPIQECNLLNRPGVQDVWLVAGTGKGGGWEGTNLSREGCSGYRPYAPVKLGMGTKTKPTHICMLVVYKVHAQKFP